MPDYYAVKVKSTAVSDLAYTVVEAMSGYRGPYYPDQTDFAGSIAFGDGLRDLAHATADDGWDNITIGIGAGQSLTTGRANILIGTNNGRDLSGSDTVNGYSGTLGNCGNTFIGRTIGAVANGALDNTLIGGNSGQNITDGMDNAAIGVASLRNIEGGSENVSLGHGTFEYVVGDGDFATGTGHRLTAVGDQAARFLNNLSANKTGGKASVYVGAQTQSASSTAYNENVFGYGAQGLGDDSVVIGNDSITKTVLKGYVGIGVTSPLVQMHIKSEASSASAIGIDVTTAGYDPYIQFMEGGSAAWRVGVDTSDSYKFKFAYGAIGSEDKVSITSGGYVGIGTASPSAHVHVKGEASSAGAVAIDVTTAGFDPYLQFMEAGSPAWRVGMDTSDGYKFKFAYGAIGSDDKFTIASDGSVSMAAATATGLSVTTSVPILRSLVTSMPTGGAEGLQFGSGAAAMNILWGSGAPSASAVKGSLYLRSDGSTTNDRMYINTDGGTTWTAVTTSA